MFFHFSGVAPLISNPPDAGTLSPSFFFNLSPSCPSEVDAMGNLDIEMLNTDFSDMIMSPDLAQLHSTGLLWIPYFNCKKKFIYILDLGI
jgi:hypothetical protein